MTRGFRLCVLALVALVVPACGGHGKSFPAGPGAGSVIGLSGNILVVFPASTPGTLIDLVAVTGLDPGYSLVGIDYRPVDGLLYGVGVNGTDVLLYQINSVTGAATAISAVPITVTAAARWGVDFNPVVDRLRVLNSADENFRINPINGARSDAPTNDTDLNPAANDISAVAYLNNFTGAVLTTAYAIAAASNSLVTIGGIDQTPSPNGGGVMNAQPLGLTIDPGSAVGFDITAANVAYATIQVGGVTRLYTINLGTGAATAVGPVGSGSIALQGMTIVR